MRHHSSDAPAPQEGQALLPQLAAREQPKVVRGGNRARIVRCHGRGRRLAAVHATSEAARPRIATASLQAAGSRRNRQVANDPKLA